jgi:indole-3-glycerol phosphate synthase
MTLLLSDLVEAARETTRRQRKLTSETTLRAEAEDLAARGTAKRMATALSAPGVSVIAEVKGASPLRGPLREDFVPAELAATYAENGAAAISVLTEEHFFAGSIEHLLAVSSSVELPTLRKDFVAEMYQIFHAATAGAAAVLLIAEVLDGPALKEFVHAAHSVGLDALVEFHRPSLLVPAVEAGSGIVGINNRNLDTMELDFEHALRLARELPPGVLRVAESAVSTASDVRRVASAGFDAILVGTALVTADEPGAVLRELVEAGEADAASPDGAGGRSGADAEDLDLPDDIDLSGAVLL